MNEDKLSKRVEKVLGKQDKIAAEEKELMQNEAFKKFLTKQKQVKAEINDFWKTLEKEMLDNDIRQIKGDWGTISIATRTGWDVDEELLPNKFYKKSVDTKRITDTFKLEGKAPKGCTPKYSKYITKRIK